MSSSIFKIYLMKIIAFFKLLKFAMFELSKLRKAKVVFFFPFYHTGGAEKVHLNIVKAIGKNNGYVFFTQQSTSDTFKLEFYQYANCHEVYDLLHRNYFIRNLFVRMISRELNKSNQLISVFGSNAVFFYELLPYLKSKIKKVDLIHAFSKPDYGIELASLPYVKYLDKRVVINNKTLIDFKELYNERKLNDYFGNITKIENGINVSDYVLDLSNKSKFTVLFVGRWSKEKRPNLFIQIAKNILVDYPEIDFVMVGSDMESHENYILRSGVIYKGEIKNEKELNGIYSKANILLITSYREGFPVVVMEAMANGVVPIVTNVGGLSEHITNEINGFLIEDEKHELFLVEKFTSKIVKLYKDLAFRENMSQTAFKYAKGNFDVGVFNNDYKELLLKN